MRRAGLLLLALAAASAPAAGPPPRDLWVAVAAPGLRGALAPLAERRRSEGMRVVVLTAEPSAERLRDRVRQVVTGHAGAAYVLLFGAVAGDPRFRVPALTGAHGRMRGEPCDAGYGWPDAAVGRVPARGEAEARAAVAKALAYEAGAPGPWRRRLAVLAGVPAYNPLVDRFVEAAAFARFDRLHPAWAGRAVYTSPSSRFSLPPSRLRDGALSLLGEGQAFVLYLGHSSAAGLYAGGGAAFLDRGDWGRLRLGAPGGVLLTFGCNGCQLAGPNGEGYGVAAARSPTGPAAVLGSHGVCYAAMAQLASEGVLRGGFEGRLPRRVGALWLAALRGVAAGPMDPLSYRLLDGVDGDPRLSQAAQRLEHREMFLLLGDPALRLPEVRDDLTLHDRPTHVEPGRDLTLRGTLPPGLRGARVTVELDRTPASAPAKHQAANDFAVARAVAEVRGDAFAARLAVPAAAPWPRLLLRVRAASPGGEAVAAWRVTVSRRGGER